MNDWIITKKLKPVQGQIIAAINEFGSLEAGKAEVHPWGVMIHFASGEYTMDVERWCPLPELPKRRKR